MPLRCQRSSLQVDASRAAVPPPDVADELPGISARNGWEVCCVVPHKERTRHGSGKEAPSPRDPT